MYLFNKIKKNLFIINMILCGNSTVYYGLTVFIQVVFVFSFLVLFYFLYVVDVERKDFEEQINLLVDNLFSDVKDQLNEIIKVNPEKISKDDFELLVYGIIDTLEEKINIDSQQTIKEINASNDNLKNNVYKILVGIMVFSVILMVVFQCYPVATILKESVITVFFIAMVELVFLTFISGKYISADPNKVKTLLGTSVKNWIQENNKISK